MMKKIYTVYGKDDWDVKYPYRFIYRNSKTNAWVRSSMVSHSFDVAFLVYLQDKNLGANSNFTNFAMKMLEMPLPE